MKDITKARVARLTENEFVEVTCNKKMSFAKGVRKLVQENKILKLKLEIKKGEKI